MKKPAAQPRAPSFFPIDLHLVSVPDGFKERNLLAVPLQHGLALRLAKVNIGDKIQQIKKLVALPVRPGGAM